VGGTLFGKMGEPPVIGSSSLFGNFKPGSGVEKKAETKPAELPKQPEKPK
jgi:hypothetical protein